MSKKDWSKTANSPSTPLPKKDWSSVAAPSTPAPKKDWSKMNEPRVIKPLKKKDDGDTGLGDRTRVRERDYTRDYDR